MNIMLPRNLYSNRMLYFCKIYIELSMLGYMLIFIGLEQAKDIQTYWVTLARLKQID